MEKPAENPPPAELPAAFRLRKRARTGALIQGGVFLAYLAVAAFVVPSPLPWIVQRLLGVVHVVLAWMTAGTAAREFAKDRKTFSLLGFKNLSTATFAGAAAAVVVGAWWLSPWAPVRVGVTAGDEIALALGDKLTLATLVMPEPMLVVLEPPDPCLPRSLAGSERQIPKSAGDYAQAVRAIAERRFDEAEQLIDRATRAGGGDAAKLNATHGQLEVFAGRYDLAPPFFEKAIAAGAQPEVLGQAAVANALAGNLKVASALADQFVAASQAGETPVGKQKSLNLQAAIALCAGRFRDAVRQTQEAQLLWQESSESGESANAHKAASRNNQAVVYAMLPTKYAGAESQFGGAMSLWGEVYGQNSPHVAGSRVNLGVLAATQSQYDRALEQLGDALETLKRTWPEPHAGWCVALRALARLNMELGRLETAEKLARQAESLLPEKLRLLSATSAGLNGAVLVGRGAYLDAAGAFRKALSDTRGMFAEDHIYRADLLLQLADVNVLRGRFDETAQSCRRASEIIATQLGQNHPAIAHAQITLGLELLERDDRTAARAEFDRAQAILSENKAELPNTPETARILAGQARLYPKRQWREGISQLRKALASDAQVFSAALGSADPLPHPATASYLFQMAQLLAANGSPGDDYEQSRQRFEQVVRLREQLLPPSHPALAETYQAFATLLTKMNRKAEATVMEEKAAAARKLQPKEKSQ